MAGKLQPKGRFNCGAPLQRTIILRFNNANVEVTLDMLKILNDADRSHWAKIGGRFVRARRGR